MHSFWEVCESKEFTDAGLQKYVKRKKLSAERSELTVVWLKTRVARSYSKVTCRHLRFLRYSLAATAFSGGVYLAASGDCNRSTYTTSDYRLSRADLANFRMDLPGDSDRIGG